MLPFTEIIDTEGSIENEKKETEQRNLKNIRSPTQPSRTVQNVNKKYFYRDCKHAKMIKKYLKNKDVFYLLTLMLPIIFLLDQCTSSSLCQHDL